MFPFHSLWNKKLEHLKEYIRLTFFSFLIWNAKSMKLLLSLLMSLEIGIYC